MAHGEITGFLERMRAGEPGAFNDVFPLVYDELRELARRLLARGGARRPLATTSLVHEAYLKLAGRDHPDWHNRNQFFAVAAVAMRHLIVDAARHWSAQKRGGGMRPAELTDACGRLDAFAEEVLAVDTALDRLAGANERLARVVELRFFAGMSVEEAAVALGVTPRTVNRDWRKARAFLRVELGSGRDA